MHLPQISCAGVPGRWVASTAKRGSGCRSSAELWDIGQHRDLPAGRVLADVADGRQGLDLTLHAWLVAGKEAAAAARPVPSNSAKG